MEARGWSDAGADVGQTKVALREDSARTGGVSRLSSAPSGR